MIRIQTQKRNIPYCPDPLRLFESLRHTYGPQNSFLLESADVTTKQGQLSLIGIRSCLKLNAYGNRVEIEAANDFGKELCAELHKRLAHFSHGSGFQFPVINQIASEDERMKAPSPIDVIRQALATEAHDPFLMAGVFAYDFLDVYEQLPAAAKDHFEFPDFLFLLPEITVEINHQTQETKLSHLNPVGNLQEILGDIEDLCRRARDAGPLVAEPISGIKVSEDVSDQEFAQWVEQLKEHIVEGDIFQAVASRTFSLPCARPLEAYARLKKMNPSPYMFVFDTSDGMLFGASPETAIKVSGSPAKVEIRPIAGTKPRGFDRSGKIDLDLDTRLEAELRLDEKELSEHLMLIDLARNDIARVSVPGSRYVPKILTVDRYAHVMHLVSYVEGKLRPDLDALHAYVACMNMGTLTGAPKIRAAQLLRQLERDKRGPYGGAVGYVTNQGDMDTAIVIRSAFVKDGTAYVRAGAGIVFDSNPKEETLETRRKAIAVIKSLGGDL